MGFLKAFCGVVSVAAATLAGTSAQAQSSYPSKPIQLVVGYAAHGTKDFWQERTHFVATTRWWPPFCAAVDFLVAAVLVVEILAGVDFRY